MNKNRIIHAYDRQFGTYANGALIATGIVFLQAQFSLATRDGPTQLSLYCLVGSLPLLAGGLVYQWSCEKLQMGNAYRQWMVWASGLGQAVAFVGLTAALFHLSGVAGLLFLDSRECRLCSVRLASPA
jgi:hypothetical protein